MITTRFGKGAAVRRILEARAHELDTIGRDMGAIREAHRLATEANPLTETDAEYRCRLIARLLDAKQVPPYVTQETTP